jgi:hypothetical protein
MKHAFQCLLRDFEITLNGVRTIHKHFRFDDRHQIAFLAQRRVSGQGFRVCGDARARGNIIADCDDGAPFCEPRSQLPILRQPLAQAIQTLSNFFGGKICQRLCTFIHFNTGNDSLLFQRFNERATVTSLLPNRLVEKNYTANKFAGVFCGK